ncbi:MAG: polysaccharide ABC transporter ATP-binding protein [Acidobacteriota bacterium]|nr:polysaccharide ABC transporter ATP-binding protein [Acidobacteriota bacterium]
MTDIAIKVEDVSKLYRLGLQEQMHESLGGAVVSFLRSPLRNFRRLRSLSTFTADDSDAADVIWALRDLSLEVDQGEVLGIIGSNGAGKTTLLKILAGITEPSHGRAVVNGRIASLLEVGTGFHSDLTGRENVYLNGTILGMTKREIDARFDEIVAFSGVERFLDTPVKRYSSGMRVRLAFAVAAHLEPEILLIDEVLSVGDAEFQRKCMGKMGEVAGAGRTVLFVSHSMNAVKTLCTRACWLKAGRVQSVGVPLDVVAEYLEEAIRPETTREWKAESTADDDQMIRLTGTRVRPRGEQRILMGEPYGLEFTFVKTTDLPFGLDLTFHLVDEMGTLVFVGSTVLDRESWRVGEGTFTATVEVPENLMNEGVYSVARVLFLKDKGSVLCEQRDVLRFEVVNPGEGRLGWIGGKKEGVVRPRFLWRLDHTGPTPLEAG